MFGSHYSFKNKIRKALGAKDFDDFYFSDNLER